MSSVHWISADHYSKKVAIQAACDCALYERQDVQLYRIYDAWVYITEKLTDLRSPADVMEEALNIDIKFDSSKKCDIVGKAIFIRIPPYSSYFREFIIR